MAETLPGVGRALVVGLGRSGTAAARALAAAGVAVVAVDERARAVDVHDDLGVPDGLRIETLRVGEDAAPFVAGVDLVVPSPGVPPSAPVLARAAELGVPVWSEPELALRLCPRRLVAITGTNGKTTVTELVVDMLTSGGVPAVGCGNLGNPVTAAATTAPEGTLLVAELSSFQLAFAHRLRPEVGALLNLAPDHLDWHGDFDAYAAAKARLWAAQEPGDWAVVGADDPPAAALGRRAAPGRVAWFSAGALPEGWVGVAVEEGVLRASLPVATGAVLDVADLPLTAPHHVGNVAAAAAVALLAGGSVAGVAAAARSFRPGAHRMQVAATRRGVAYVDDSKATNPHAAAAALAAFPSIVWIAGGQAKGIDLSVLGAHVAAVRHAILLGEAAAELGAVCATRDVPVTTVTSIEEAVEVAAAVAGFGDTVLLAPACASFDLFRDYAERGERFAAAARALDDKGGGAA